MCSPAFFILKAFLKIPLEPIVFRDQVLNRFVGFFDPAHQVQSLLIIRQITARCRRASCHLLR